MLNRNPNPAPGILPEDKKEGSWMLPDSVDKIQEKLGGLLKKSPAKPEHKTNPKNRPRQ